MAIGSMMAAAEAEAEQPPHRRGAVVRSASQPPSQDADGRARQIGREGRVGRGQRDAMAGDQGHHREAVHGAVRQGEQREEAGEGQHRRRQHAGDACRTAPRRGAAGTRASLGGCWSGRGTRASAIAQAEQPGADERRLRPPTGRKRQQQWRGDGAAEEAGEGVDRERAADAVLARCCRSGSHSRRGGRRSWQGRPATAVTSSQA